LIGHWILGALPLVIQDRVETRLLAPVLVFTCTQKPVWHKQAGRLSCCLPCSNTELTSVLIFGITCTARTSAPSILCWRLNPPRNQFGKQVVGFGLNIFVKVNWYLSGGLTGSTLLYNKKFTASIYSFRNSNFAGDKGDKWLLTQVSVPAASQTSDWNLIIQATAGDGVAGDMAIDGFKMTNGLCSGDQKTTGPGKNCSTINFFSSYLY